MGLNQGTHALHDGTGVAVEELGVCLRKFLCNITDTGSGAAQSRLATVTVSDVRAPQGGVMVDREVVVWYRRRQYPCPSLSL